MPKKVITKIGEVVRSLREEKKISKRNLASLLGKSIEEISLVEDDFQSLTLYETEKLCHVFGITLNEFISRVQKNNFFND